MQLGQLGQMGPKFTGHVSDTVEGSGRIMAAINESARALSDAVYEQFASHGVGDFANKAISALHDPFGGHEEKPITETEGIR